MQAVGAMKQGSIGHMQPVSNPYQRGEFSLSNMQPVLQARRHPN